MKFLGHAPETCIAFGSEGHQTGQALHRDVAALLPALAPLRHGERVLLVFENDRYLLVAALLALWSKRLVAVIPPDHRRSTLTGLKARQDVRAVLHDTDSGLPYRVQDLVGERAGDADAALGSELLRAWSSEAIALNFVGGSAAGRGYDIPVSFGELRAELDRLARHVEGPPAPRVGCRASMGHRFGVVWGLLWPLSCGGSFARGPWVEGEAVDLLIDTPPLGTPPSGVRVLSGLRVLRGASSSDTLDVFTSNTAGALGIRSESRAAWRLLPGVRLERGLKGGTDVHLTCVDGPRLVRDDIAAVSDGFHVRGRPDRRAYGLDLDALEGEIAHRHGALVSIEAAGEPPRLFVAFERRDARIRDQLVKFLTGLAQDRISPKAWSLRSLTERPVNPVGRTYRERLLALFGLGPDGAPRAHELIIEDLPAEQDGEAQFQIYVPENYRWFDGHFDQYPILPAAIQLHEIVLPCARRVGYLAGAVLRFERLKFSGRVEPGHTLGLKLTKSDAGIRFDLTSCGAPVTSGRFSAGARSR